MGLESFVPGRPNHWHFPVEYDFEGEALLLEQIRSGENLHSCGLLSEPSLEAHRLDGYRRPSNVAWISRPRALAKKAVPIVDEQLAKATQAENAIVGNRLIRNANRRFRARQRLEERRRNKAMRERDVVASSHQVAELWKQALSHEKPERAEVIHIPSTREHALAGVALDSAEDWLIETFPDNHFITFVELVRAVRSGERDFDEMLWVIDKTKVRELRLEM